MMVSVTTYNTNNLRSNTSNYHISDLSMYTLVHILLLLLQPV